jgi:hypothetical protein
LIALEKNVNPCTLAVPGKGGYKRLIIMKGRPRDDITEEGDFKKFLIPRHNRRTGDLGVWNNFESERKEGPRVLEGWIEKILRSGLQREI